MRVLLIGGGGFVGSHLTSALQQHGHMVFSADLPAVAAASSEVLPVDLTVPETIDRVLKETHPDRIFLLAAMSSVAMSWEKPDVAVAVNIGGALNVFQSVAQNAPGARLIYIGSGEEYGTLCSEEHPFAEDMPGNPGNPYAVTKFATGRLFDLLAGKRGIDCVHLRPFNHYGPRQRNGFVIADFCSQIARAENGSGPRRIRVGNLAVRRDFLFVEDVIDAYCRIAEAEQAPPHRVYNLSTGTAYSLQYILDFLVSQATVEIEVEIDPAKFRPVEIPVLIASNSRIGEDFGWRPATSLETGLRKTLDWWREQTRPQPK